MSQCDMDRVPLPVGPPHNGDPINGYIGAYITGGVWFTVPGAVAGGDAPTGTNWTLAELG